MSNALNKQRNSLWKLVDLYQRAVDSFCTFVFSTIRLIFIDLHRCFCSHRLNRPGLVQMGEVPFMKQLTMAMLTCAANCSRPCFGFDSEALKK